MKIKPLIALCIALACLIAASGCASTTTENGVTIERKRSSGLLNLIPFF